MANRCRHRGTWLLADGYLEWCYECGALRKMYHSGPAEIAPRTRWTRPVGIGGANPWPMKDVSPERRAESGEGERRNRG